MTISSKRRAQSAPAGAARRVLVRGALVVVGLVVLAAVSQPLWLGPLLAHLLTQASGRSVSFASASAGLTAELAPVLHCRGVRIANAPWAETSRPFAELGEFTAVLSWKSLFQPRAVISLMVLRDGEVDLERRADGLRNWRLRDPENRGPGRYKVLALQAERATVRFRHEGLDLALAATSSPEPQAAAASSPAASGSGLPVRLDVSGRWRGLDFTSRMATGPVLTFLETDTLFPLRGRVQAGGAVLEIDGRAGDIFREPLFDADVLLAGAALAPFGPFLGARYAASPPRAFRVAGHLEASDHVYALTALAGRIGASDLVGELRIARTRDRTDAPAAGASTPAPASAEPPVRHAVQARLKSRLVDVDDLHWLAGPPAAASAASVATAADASRVATAAAPDARPPFARRYDGSLGLEVARLKAAEAPWLRGLALEAALADGRLSVSKVDFGIGAQGHATGRAELDLRQRPHAAEAELVLAGLGLEQLLASQPAAKRITGTLHAEARVKAQGDDARTLLASASGTVTARLAGGTIPSLLDAEIGLQGGKIVRSLLGGSEALPIRCAAAALDLKAGTGTLRSLVFETERTRTTGTGRVDLGARTLDLVLTPEARQGGLFVLERSIRLHGPLAKPEKSLVARQAAGPANRAACPASG